MTRIMFDSPFLLGFERTRDLIERAAKAAGESYPPYNVQALGENGVRITLAVAGFSAGQLSVDVDGRQLTVTGRKDGEDADRAFLHRGIAARNFTRSFVLADGMEVAGAVLEHGLLHVDVVRPEPERRVTSVPIRTEG
jgi:HSP20 family molecular chaperone IbpA